MLLNLLVTGFMTVLACPDIATCHSPPPVGMLLTYNLCSYAQQLVQRALGGESDRSLKFGRDQGMWLVSLPPVVHL